DEKLGFQKVAPFYYYPGWWEGSTSIHHFINIDKWNALPKSYQQVIRSASDTANISMTAKYDAENPGAIKRLVAGGAQLRAYPQPILDACYKAANDVYAEISGSNPNFKKIYDNMV